MSSAGTDTAVKRRRSDLIASLDDLGAVAQEEVARQSGFSHRLVVCSRAACVSDQDHDILAALTHEIERAGKGEEISVMPGGCFENGSSGPVVALEPDGIRYHHVTPADARAIVKSIDHEPIADLLVDRTQPFYTRQQRVVLDGCGVINPASFDDYVAHGGYCALLACLRTNSPEQVVQAVAKAGLRGRGGLGFPTGLKWATVAKAGDPQKYVVLNADEGDPGAFANRSLLESNPLRVIEGMTIAAYAVGATQGYVYVRAGYPLAVKRVEGAIRLARRNGLLGNAIGNTPFGFTIDVCLGAGAYVCGEETALIAAIEGGRGVPRPCPPFPTASGLWGHPTLINNVETMANIPPIIQHGADWFAAIGTESSKGTKTFGLSGRVVNCGLIEVPMGTSLREIVMDIGGGCPDGHALKAVHIGGPMGGCLPAESLDVAVDYEALRQAGASMGTGSLVVLDDTCCVVDLARYFMGFCRSASCGKCFPCRVLTQQMHDILTAIASGDGRSDTLAQLETLCEVVGNTSLCGLGRMAPTPVVSTIRYFRDDYLAHIFDKTCSAGVCPLGTKAMTR